MYRVKEAIIVEGAYDKIKLSGFIDGVIFTTGGFAIFKNKKMQTSVRTLAEKCGIVILSDSDFAGLKIRNFIKQLTPGAKILHAYVPEIAGKEKRKKKPSSEGILGVEGMSETVIIDAIKKSGATVDGSSAETKCAHPVTKADFFRVGLCGGPNSSILRSQLARSLGLPSKLSANMLLDVVNSCLTRDEFCELVNNLSNS